MSPIDNKSRRGLLKAVFGGVFTTLMLPLRRAGAVDERRLKFFHTHTGKRLDVVYKRNGEYVPEALSDINAFLFDFRSGESTEMDPHLLDLIYDLREALGSEGIYEVISAYRSPKTNDMLRQRSGGVVKNSQHLLGNRYRAGPSLVNAIRLAQDPQLEQRLLRPLGRREDWHEKEPELPFWPEIAAAFDKIVRFHADLKR